MKGEKVGRRRGGGGTERGDRVEEKEEKVLVLNPVFLPFSCPHFPLLCYTSLKVYPKTRGSSSLSPPSPIPPFLFCLTLSLSPSTSPLSPPSAFPSLLALYIYLNTEQRGCRETQNQHTVLVLKLSAEAEGHCSAE